MTVLAAWLAEVEALKGCEYCTQCRQRSTLPALVRRAVEALREIANFQDNHWAMKAADDCLADLTRLAREGEQG